MITYRSDVRGINAERLGGFFEGWPSTPTPDTLLRVLGRSSQVALALEGDEVVGFAYAISDGLLAAHVPLLEVRASHRGRGIGSELIRRLLEALGDLYMIDVVCEEDLRPFYDRLGATRLAGMGWRNRSAPVLANHA